MINNYKIIIEWSVEDGVYLARVPELDGVVTHGKSRTEALLMAEDAIDLHIKSLKAHNELEDK